MAGRVRKISEADLRALNAHPLADLMPMAENEIIVAIGKDISDHGFRKDRPIVLCDGMILDGRNRREATLVAQDIDKTYRAAWVCEFDPDSGSPLDFVLSENVNRRHLTKSQRAIIAANVNAWAVGMNQYSEGSESVPTQKVLAKQFQISDRLIRSANHIRDRGHEALMQAVSSGQLEVKNAEALVELGDDELTKILIGEEKLIVTKAKEIRTKNLRASRALRVEKINEIAAKGGSQMEALPRKQFAVIYADCPWEGEAYSDETGQDKGRPYPTMSVEEIMALCAGENTPALDDAVLFLWVNNNRIDDGIDVIRAWNFDYVTSYSWNKKKIGNGFWVRDLHEVLMIAKRGNFPAPDQTLLEPSNPTIPRGKHSEKPAFFAEVIDRQFPDLAKLELFQRKQSLAKGDKRLHRRKKGRWAFWGNEAGEC